MRMMIWKKHKLKEDKLIEPGKRRWKQRIGIGVSLFGLGKDEELSKCYQNGEKGYLNDSPAGECLETNAEEYRKISG